MNHPDLADRASSETDRAIELRARDRQRKLIAKIDAALQRIEDNTYGYCEETGEPISLKRLEAGPSRRFRWKRRSATRSARRSIATNRVRAAAMRLFVFGLTVQLERRDQHFVCRLPRRASAQRDREK